MSSMVTRLLTPLVSSRVTVDLGMQELSNRNTQSELAEEGRRKISGDVIGESQYG
jgi:hypothetical protein